MKLAIVAATGGVGRELLQQALEAGHDVTAVLRNPDKLSRPVRAITADLTKGTNTATDRYWGRSWYVWNNDKDTAYVYNRYGSLIDKCSYNNRNASSVYC